jgi:hypothetical protein
VLKRAAQGAAFFYAAKTAKSLYNQSMNIFRFLIIVFFNAVPLFLVLSDTWRPFDVMAFYWLELGAIGFFTVLKLLISGLFKITHQRKAEGIGDFFGLVFFPLHFGFFMVMLCFMVGSFLPEGTPTRILNSPFIPLIVVIENFDFFTLLPLALAWQAASFLSGYLYQGRYRNKDAPEMGRAYGNLAILFISGFMGLLVAMQTDQRIWGAVFLIALKTLVSLVLEYVRQQENPERAV